MTIGVERQVRDIPLIVARALPLLVLLAACRVAAPPCSGELELIAPAKFVCGANGEAVTLPIEIRNPTGTSVRLSEIAVGGTGFSLPSAADVEVSPLLDCAAITSTIPVQFDLPRAGHVEGEFARLAYLDVRIE